MIILEIISTILVYLLLCLGCGFYIAGALRQGRPWHWSLVAADVPTNGVATIKTSGKNDSQQPASAARAEPVRWWNGCDKTVPDALRYLAENQRPAAGGSERFNSEHLYQLAGEIERMASKPLYLAPPAAAPEVPEWQPIETAPKDGRKLILGRHMVRSYIGLWESGNSEWIESSGYAVARDPTHWMPLPVAPQPEGRKS